MFADRLGDSRLSTEELEARLLQEAASLSVLYRGAADCGFDMDRGHWLQMDLPLPKGCLQERVPVVILIPWEFPAVGPVHFILPKDLRTEAGLDLGLLFVLTELVNSPSGWDAFRLPSIPWRKGDDLDRIVAPLLAVLAAGARLDLTPSTEHRPLD